jgi:hypothetical protein
MSRKSARPIHVQVKHPKGPVHVKVQLQPGEKEGTAIIALAHDFPQGTEFEWEGRNARLGRRLLSLEARAINWKLYEQVMRMDGRGFGTVVWRVIEWLEPPLRILPDLQRIEEFIQDAKDKKQFP